MNPSFTSPFLAVDWGTSSLRVWALSPECAVLAETRAPQGMDTLAPSDFEPVLRARIADLGLPAADLPNPIPVILCGMVGARQGWREAGYVDVPAPLTDVVDRAVAVPADGLHVRILPGLAQRNRDRPDVMRGEETQLLGLILDEPAATATVCMPGTHSKWVTLEAGRATAFSTVMTGELFALFAHHSIVRHTIAGADPSGDPRAPAFLDGVRAGLADPAGLARDLFAIRAESLLFGLDGSAAADRLSGLLIGAEVASAGAGSDGAVTLVASGRLAGLYEAALRLAGREVRLVDADAAVRAGLTAAARRLF